MTVSQQRTYAKQYDRWLVQQDRITVRVALAGLKTVFNRVLPMLQRVGPQATLGMLPLLVRESDHGFVLERIYTTVGVTAAQREYNRLIPPAKSDTSVMLTKDRDVPELPLKPNRPSGLIRIDHNSETWRQRMMQMARSSETAQRIAGITEKTRQLVRDALTQGYEQGLSLPKLVRNLRKAVVSRTRAILIARTETTRAANAGHEAGAQTTLLTLNKVWIATLDARTRPSHVQAGKQKPVARDGFFIVNGKQMRYPGDPAGGASEVCRCRCVVAYVPATNIFD